MKTLNSFISEARKRGFSDLQIRKVLLDNHFKIEKIEEAFTQSSPKFKNKNQICIFLSDELISKLDKRAKKNLFTLPEQIEDILRRSCLSTKPSSKEEKLDDVLLSLFSRKSK
jgi:hypothetical protein